MSENEELPVSMAVNDLRKLNQIIENEQWDECVPLSEKILSNVRLALDKRTCRTGKPHLDGVYSTGRMYYQYAPKKIVRTLDKMNRIIRTAKESVPK